MGKTIGIVIAILLLGAGLYFVFGRSSDSASKVSTPSGGTVSSETFSGTMMDLLKLGQDYECTFNMTDGDGNETGGTVYVADGGNKMYGEFALSLSGGPSHESFIMRDGTYNYMWSSLQAQGMRTLIEEGDDDMFAAEGNEAVDYGVQNDQDYSFDCKAWSVNESMFVPPAGIDFMDFSNTAAEAAESFKEMDIDCSVCDQMPDGDAKTQCLSALGC